LVSSQKGKLTNNPSHQEDKEDVILVLGGDHFNYIKSQTFPGSEKLYADSGSLVNLVGAAVASKYCVTARSYLSIEVGHDTVPSLKSFLESMK
jgi:hypothetical protein